jgi:hypothetical protein
LYIGGYTGKSGNKTSDVNLITEIDEIRIWKKHRTAEEIHDNFQKKVLQDTTLVGYWDFDDLRNHKKEIFDISYYNNPGILYNGSVLVPQPANILETIDTLIVRSSNADTDSIQFSFIDNNDIALDVVTVNYENNRTTLIYDISSWPFTISHLKISEFYPGCPKDGFNSKLDLAGFEQTPIATPLLNWQKYYTSPDFGNFFTSLVASEFPAKTNKVILGLKDENQQVYDTVVYSENTFPYHSSLAFNGTDNYIEPSTSISEITNYTMMCWIKTTTKDGGSIINFSDSPYGMGS